MFEMIKLAGKAAADRKGATALEYALIASALAAVTLIGFKAFFEKINAFLKDNVGSAAGRQ